MTKEKSKIQGKGSARLLALLMTMALVAALLPIAAIPAMAAEDSTLPPAADFDSILDHEQFGGELPNGLIPFESVEEKEAAFSPYAAPNGGPDYFAVEGDIAAPIAMSTPQQQRLPANTWIDISLWPYDFDVSPYPVTKKLYTDNNGLGGALFLDGAPAGTYMLTYYDDADTQPVSINLGILEIAAESAPFVLALGGFVPSSGITTVRNSSQYGWLNNLFSSGSLSNAGIYDSFDTRYYYEHADGSVWLTLVGENIKPTDIQSVTVNGNETNILSGVIPADIRVSRLKLLSSATLTGNDTFYITVTGIETPVSTSLERKNSAQYFLDTADIDKLKLHILPVNESSPSATIYVRIYDRYYSYNDAQILQNTTAVTLSSGKYTLDLAPDVYLFGDGTGQSNYICLYTNNDEVVPSFTTSFTVNNTVIVYLPVNDTATSSSTVGVAEVLADINGQSFYIQQSENMTYRSNYAFSIADSTFAPVQTVTIAQDDTFGYPWYNYYKFNATGLLTVGETYYLMLGDVPIRKLIAVASFGGITPPSYSNQINGSTDIYMGDKFSFAINKQNGLPIAPSEWSVKLTDLLTNVATTYSYGSTLRLLGTASANYARMETATSPAAGIYKVQYYRNSEEIIGNYNNTGADEFSYSGSPVFVVIAARNGIYGQSVGLNWFSDTRDPYFSMIGYTQEASSSVPELKADFYPVTAPTAGTVPTTVALPATTSRPDASFSHMITPAELKNAGIIPGFYHVVISMHGGDVLYAIHVSFNGKFFANPNAATLTPATHTYPAAEYGYAEPLTAQEFTITNTSEDTITNAAAALTNAAAFEISTVISSTTIDAEGMATVSVRPRAGLAAGTYIDTLTTTGDDGLSISAALSFTVDRKPITITDVTALSRAYDGTTGVTLAGGTLGGVLEGDASGVSFTLGTGTVESPNVGTAKSVVTNIALTGAKSANYTLTQPNNITVEISKAAGPAAPALDFTVSGDGFPKTVTITQLPGAEYSFDGDSYSATNTYASSEAEDVTLYIRIAATATHEASEASTATINTADQNQDAPEMFELEIEIVGDVSYTVTIPRTDGAEYSFDGVAWSGIEGANVKTECMPGETIVGYRRFSAKEGYNASPAVNASVTLPLFQVKAPTASPNGGTFTGSVSVTLGCATAGADIYYTTDGSEPTSSATKYAEPFTLTDTTTVKAIAVKAGMRDSETLNVAFSKTVPQPGGAGGGSVSPSDTVKTAPAADGSVSVNYTQSGDAVAVELPDSKVTELISKSSGTMSIDLSKVSNATSASLPASALEKLANAKLAVEIRLPQGAITLEAEAASSVAAQAGESRVYVGIRSVAVPLLNAATREAIGHLAVYDISISSGNMQITSFDGASATIVLPYTLKAGETATGISAFYVDGNGNMDKLPTSYDASSAKATFTTMHLSLYAIGYDEALTGPWTNPFHDIKASDWFYGDVEYVNVHGLMNGTGAAAFSPDAKISRAMIVTILYRYEQTPVGTYPATAFTDVPAGQWYTDAVAWAGANGIVNGIGDNKFAPDDHITRQDLAAIIMRYTERSAKQFPVTLQYQTFADESGIAEYAKNAVQMLYCGGIIHGKPGGLFDPTGTATRAEAAALLRRFIEAVK
jgi:hypothetical protein